MKTFVAEDIYGRIIEICAYTETNARQKAEKALGYGNVIRFYEALVR
ncbi:MAG: hypothetical protein V7765_21945 [Oleispira sp.]